MDNDNKSCKRQLAKLFLNNLHGKMATNEEHEKTPGYKPVGLAITSYAMNKPGFICADTDSIYEMR